MPDDRREALAPRENPDLIGHAEAEATFLGAWSEERLHHAWLIAGAGGIGKATLAYRVARFLLANGERPEAGLFGAAPPSSLALASDDPVFRRVTAGAHPDLMTVERAFDEKRGRTRTEIGVDQVRAIGSFMHLTPAEGGWRIVIVDALDDLNANAANALLKVLEEPPRRALLLLVSHAPGRLLPTIRSRCRQIRLEPLALEQVGAILSRQRPDLDGDTLRGLAVLSEGSPGRAMATAELGGLDLYRGMLGLLPRLPNPGAALHQFADHLSRSTGGPAWEAFQELYPWWLARVARAAARGESPPEIVPGESEIARNLVARLGVDRLIEVWENVTHLFSRADALNLDRKQVVINAILALADRGRR